MVGGGPAGCATAIALARHGATTVLLDRSAGAGPRIGETLPPEVRLLLGRLGVWDRFQEEGHIPSPGIVAAWGEAEPYANDFITNPYGPGWRVDRDRFDSMLADAARQAGAVVLKGAGADWCEPDRHGGWRLTATCGADSLRLSADIVVDAAGRASGLRPRLGARRIAVDRLVGVVGFMTPGSADSSVDERALIEATEHGWWYSAWLPDGRLVLTFQTDAGPGLRAGWARHLAAAAETAARAQGGADPQLRVVSACSQRSEPAAGCAWLTVGDAAAAHDPLAGLGIYRALQSGISAADAVAARGGGARTPFADYADDARARFEQYLVLRTRYYRGERRWPEAPFWSSRHRGPGR